MNHRLLDGYERRRLWLRLAIRAALIAAGALLIRYVGLPLLTLLLPFVLALLMAWALNAPARWLQRRLSVSRKTASMALVALILIAAAAAVIGLIWAAVAQVRSLLENWPSVAEAVEDAVSGVNGWLNDLSRHLPREAAAIVEQLTDAAGRWLEGLRLDSWFTGLARQAPGMVSDVSGFAMAATMFVMSSYFITGDYPRLRFWVTDRVPAGARGFCKTVKNVFMEAFGGYVRSQLLLSLGVFVILAVGFLILRQPYGLLLAAGLAVLDFIPIVGAGTVLVPWAVIDLILHRYGEAIALAVLWGLIILFRQFAEPKILGSQTGLPPILSLVGIYVGMRLGGVPGMILGPLLLLVILNLARLGMFRPMLRDLRLAAGDVASIFRDTKR